jgi:uncharacterized protein YbjQ (UPF0145 family)
VNGTGRPWDSLLTAGEFAAIRLAGFEPVGQVFGAAVYYLATVAGVTCPGTTAALPVAQRLYEARRTALDRMATKCARLGGHGIVGASMQVTEVPGTEATPAAIKFTAAGTAVRASGAAPLARPFTCDLSGSDFAKVIMAGWVPAGIVLGISVAGLHDDLVTASSGPWGTGNGEVPSYTSLITRARQGARDHLERSVQELGADGVVVSAMTLRVRSDSCRAHAAAADHFAEAVITGTALARFGHRDSTALPPVPAVIRLGETAHPRGTPGRPAKSG